MSHTLRYLLAACMALAIAGCPLKPLPGGLPGTGLPQDGVSQTIPLIHGELVDAAGRPVAGADVRAYRAPYRIEGLSSEPVSAVSATTDAQGGFQLVAPPEGSVTVEARDHGQKAMRLGITVGKGARVELGTLSLLPTGRVSGRVTAPAGTVLLGTDVFIPGTDYLAKTASDGSYLLQDLPVGTYQLAAVRTSFQPCVVDGVAVTSGGTTQAPDLELSLDSPVLTSLDPTSGGPGTVVTLRGTNFGESKHTILQVTFGDTLATRVRRLSDTEIEATVPMGATSGGVVVRSNGIASALRAFSAIQSLILTPSSRALYPGATSSFSLRALDERGEQVPDPFVVWALRDPAIGTVSARGDLTALGRGVCEVTVRSGVPMAQGWLGVGPYRATTLYGNGISASAGDGGPGSQASFRSPYAVARDATGSLYVAEGSATVIRRIAPDGTVTRFAGDGTKGWVGDGGPALQAGLGEFTHLAVDAEQRLWLSDAGHHVLRFIPLDERGAPAYRAGYVYRAVGTGAPGYTGSGAAGIEAALNFPMGLTPAPEGVYVADKLNHRIRLVDSAMRVLDVLGTGSPLQLDQPAAQATAPVGNPSSCALDQRGNMLIATTYQLLYWCRVSGSYFGRSMEAGTVYPIAAVNQARAFHGDCEGWQEALSETPQGLQPDGTGGYWFLDSQLVRHLAVSGRIETLAGKPMEQASRQAFGPDGEGMNALRFSLANPTDLVLLGDDLLVLDSSYCRVVRLERQAY